jgi:hypothetical protein
VTSFAFTPPTAFFSPPRAAFAPCIGASPSASLRTRLSPR